MRLSLILLLFAAVAAFAQDTRLYVVTHVDLMPPYTADGTPILVKFAADSRQEKGAARFELLQEPGRKNHFTIVSVWENQAAFDAHLSAEHTKQFREKIQPMLGGPLDERFHSLLQ
jgi:quinol monooxygenase YgiN